MYINFACCILVSLSVFRNVIEASEPYLELSNNGPAILGSSITFTAFLHNYPTDKTLYYTFNDGVEETKNKEAGTNISFTVPYTSNLYSEGKYKMTITVKKFIVLEYQTIAENYTSFEVGESLFGHIEILRDGISTNGRGDVGTGENFTMIAIVEDGNGYLKDARFEYMWSIDKQRFNYRSSSLNYNYSYPGSSLIVVVAFATLPSNNTVFGMFTKELSVQVPVNITNVAGNPYIHHNETLSLNITCGGTPPFEFCSSFFFTNTSVENFTCPMVVVTETCTFQIQKYFQKNGRYQLAYRLSNDVKTITKSMQIIVYSVPSKGLLSIVIIPVVCTLFTLIIIAFGIAYHRHQRKKLLVEVACFNFHDDSETYGDKTPFEELWDQLKCRCWRDNLPSENEPLLT